MASSLEELLAKEGFKGSRRMTRSRSSFQSDAVTVPHFRDQQKRHSVGERIKTERTKSDVSQYQTKGESSHSNAAKSMRPRDNLAKREIIDEGLKNGSEEKPPSITEVDKKFDPKSSENKPRHEITEVSEQEDNRVKDIYSTEMSNAKRGKEKNSNEFSEKEKWREMPVKDAKVDKRHGSVFNLNMQGHFRGNTRKSVEGQGNSYNKSTSKSFGNSFKKNQENTVQAASNLALDEVAVQAIVSILNGYIKRFLKDEDFRTTLRHNCFSSLNFIDLEEENSTETKVIRSLEQAIETIEQVAEESMASKDLKRASLQLSIITGLSLNDLKYEFTCGIPNYKLSACAHLYLSVVYKIQRKDKVSAKHLLQVFCDSPFQARTTLLPELWEYLFSPHLLHLKAWYNNEVDTLADRPSRTRKLNLLEKVYNENLDSGTYMFAAYYKDWLTDGVEPPSIPSISIPSISVMGSRQGSSNLSSELSSSIDPFSPQPIVSKKLYDSVFSSLSKPGVEKNEDNEDDNDVGTCVRGSYGSTIVKQTFSYASEIVKFTDQDFQEDSTKNVPVVLMHSQKGISMADEEEQNERNPRDDIGDSFIPQQTYVHSHMPDSRENEFTLAKVTRSNLEMQNTNSSVDSRVSQSSEELVSNSILNPNKIGSSFVGLSFPTIPQEFICPLTGNLFEEPVTIETGQTFEQAALKSWFEKGHRTCPVTGATLNCVSMPLTNLVLKRLIHHWKSEHLSQFLDSASQILKNSRDFKLKLRDEIATFKLESFFTVLNEEDNIAYARHLIILGVLPFLLRRFELGNLEEKTHVAALFLNFIEADSCCIYQIARDINKKCLLELLHSKEVTPRTKAISLLTELVALKRRKDVTSFLSGLKGEDVFVTMHVLVVHLKNSPPHQKPLIAVLLLHFDLLLEPQKYSIYREQAVNSISVALDASLNNEKVREKCCRALFVLAGHFSSTGKILTKRGILKEVGYQTGISEAKNPDHEEEGLLRNGAIFFEEEEERSKVWLVNLLESMIGDGESPFLKTVSRCLDSRHPDLVSICLITIAWLSSSLSMQCNAGLHLAAFLAVISQVKEVLENAELELKTLASMCLLNFSKISECRTLLMTMAEDIAAPLHKLADVTWTAKELQAIVSGVDL